jgi:hypothetical protein
MWKIPLFVIGLYLVVRAVVEPFVIDLGDPSTYRLDWGGPHLAGVLAVHIGPGLVAAALMTRWFIKRRRNSGPPQRAHRRPDRRADRPADRGPDRRADHGADPRADRGADPRADRGVDRRADRGADRRAEPWAERKPTRMPG